MNKLTQRRLAAIVVVDVVGYSRLMGVDEVGTLAALKAHRAELIDLKVADHGGRIVKTMGDGLLLEFPSVVDAAQCAIEVQSQMAERNQGVSEDGRIMFRIGVNLGDVIIDGDDILGDGVNIAARLEGLSEPGGVAISGRVHDDVRNRLDTVFTDAGALILKNIVHPVQVWRWSPTAVVTMIGGDAPLPLPSIPSIAVLPFANMSGDAEQEYFADGMTEDIITELSRFEDLFVIARNTSFAYKGQKIDVKNVAQELGVHFVLEGSVRKAGQRVRITAQLIDGQDGGHVWAERYDGTLEDVFDLQERVTGQVVASISPHITQADIERIGRGERLFDEAHDLGWRAQGTYRAALRLNDPPMLDLALEMATEAVRMNAKCGIAYQTICFAYAQKSLRRWGEDLSSLADLSEAWARKFLAQLPKSYKAHLCLGLARSRKGQFQDAFHDLQHAHELNRNDTAVLRYWAYCEACAGEFDSAKTHAQMAIRLSPKDLAGDVAYLTLAMAAFIEKDAARFEEFAGKAIQLAPNAPIRRAMMIAYAAEAGNQTLLERHRTELMRSAPNFIDSLFNGKNIIFQKPEHAAILLDGLRKAGFPE